MYKEEWGEIGERLAEKYFLKNGFKILERRYRIRGGEIDLIATKDKTLIFVEVKTRTSHEYGAPEEAVHPTKQKRIIRAVRHYLAFHKIPSSMPLQIDVAAIDLDSQTHHACLRHIPRAVEADIG